jgi:hypothetical protein
MLSNHDSHASLIANGSTPKSKIYLGSKPRTTANNLRQSIENGTIEDYQVSLQNMELALFFLPVVGTLIG